MLYAKIINGAVAEFPVTLKQLNQRLAPKVFTEKSTDADLADTGYVTVAPTETRSLTVQETKDQKYVVKGIQQDATGKWVRVMDLEPVPTDKIAARIADRWRIIRARRDEFLQEHDWRVLRHEREVRLGLAPTDNIAKLDAYAQALADITKADDPFLVQFPPRDFK